MADQLGDLTRTHTCGALRVDDVGADAVDPAQEHDVGADILAAQGAAGVCTSEIAQLISHEVST